jgi:hypothetical protein
MLGAVYTHYALHDKLDRMAPGIVFSLLLFTRLIIYRMGKYSNLNANTTEVKAKDENEEEASTEESNDEEQISNEKKTD